MHLLDGWACMADKLLQTFGEFDETETETVKSICRMGWSSPIPRAYCLWLGTPWLNESNQELLEAKPTQLCMSRGVRPGSVHSGIHTITESNHSVINKPIAKGMNNEETQKIQNAGQQFTEFTK